MGAKKWRENEHTHAHSRNGVAPRTNRRKPVSRTLLLLCFGAIMMMQEKEAYSACVFGHTQQKKTSQDHFLSHLPFLADELLCHRVPDRSGGRAALIFGLSYPSRPAFSGRSRGGSLRFRAARRPGTPTVYCCCHPARPCTNISASSLDGTGTSWAAPWWPSLGAGLSACRRTRCRPAHWTDVPSLCEFVCVVLVRAFSMQTVAGELAAVLLVSWFPLTLHR